MSQSPVQRASTMLYSRDGEENGGGQARANSSAQCVSCRGPVPMDSLLKILF